MKTKFTDLKVQIGESTHVFFDGNSKVSGIDPVPNCFSLVAIDDCPGSTAVCRRECYVAGLKAHAPDLFAKYQHNSAVMRRIVATGSLTDEWHRAVIAFANHARRHAATTGFRWHVSGDIFSNHYAMFIATVCRRAPSVNFWIYTRSFQWLGRFKHLRNLTVNLSADEDNLEQVREFHEAWGYRICYMATSDWNPFLPEGSVIFPSYALRGRDHTWWQGLSAAQRRMVCPPDFFGQSPALRCGPCRKCLKS